MILFFAFASLKMLRVNCGDKITRLKASPIGHFMDIDKLDKPCHAKPFFRMEENYPISYRVVDEIYSPFCSHFCLARVQVCKLTTAVCRVSVISRFTS